MSARYLGLGRAYVIRDDAYYAHYWRSHLVSSSKDLAELGPRYLCATYVAIAAHGRRCCCDYSAALCPITSNTISLPPRDRDIVARLWLEKWQRPATALQLELLRSSRPPSHRVPTPFPACSTASGCRAIDCGTHFYIRRTKSTSRILLQSRLANCHHGALVAISPRFFGVTRGYQTYLWLPLTLK